MYIYYTYAYLRSKDSDTAKAGTPYYIGKGKGNRAYQNHRYHKPPNNKSKIVFFETNLSEIGALALERRLIAWYGRKDLGTGILNNLTGGGEGGSGRLASIQEREKARKAKLGIEKSEAHKAKLRGPKSEEHKKNSANANRARCLGKPAHNKGISGPLKAIPKSEEHKANMRKPKVKATCPFCGKVGGISQMKRWHFNNCKSKPL